MRFVILAILIALGAAFGIKKYNEKKDSDALSPGAPTPDVIVNTPEHPIPTGEPVSTDEPVSLDEGNATTSVDNKEV